ncbi:hypothetical protein ACS0TY_007644 [Phlomoides rotata]
MAGKPVKYCLVDTFTKTVFRGNPTAVCLLEEEKDSEWLSSVAREFNQAVTSYLTRFKTHESKFELRWFTRDGDEISICGHATLASSYFILSRVLPTCESVELSTLSGVLTARRIPESSAPGSFLTEVNFPTLPLEEFDEVSAIKKMLNGAPIMEIKKTTVEDYLLVVLPCGEDVKEVKADIDAIRKYDPVRGIIVTAPAPPESEFDFYTRFFCPNLGVDEDHVCGSSHCALAPYWSQRLGKNDFVSYAASTRSGVVHVHLDEKNQRVVLRGKAVTTFDKLK